MRRTGDKLSAFLSEEGLTLLRAWARDGCSGEQLARRIGVHPRTLCRWKRAHPEIAEALRQSREVVDVRVEDALLEKALSGDMRAILFWLKNRRPSAWRDRRDEGEASREAVIVDDL